MNLVYAQYEISWRLPVLRKIEGDSVRRVSPKALRTQFLPFKNWTKSADKRKGVLFLVNHLAVVKPLSFLLRKDICEGLFRSSANKCFQKTEIVTILPVSFKDHAIITYFGSGDPPL